MIYQGLKKYQVHEIVVHCTATRAAWWEGKRTSEKVAEVRRWHMQDRKWADIGYHWLIDRDGTLAKGRPETVIGAGVLGHNNGVIHITLFGGFDSTAYSKFAENFTPEQEKTLLAKIREISTRTDIKLVTGHNDYAARECPGFQVKPWFESHGGMTEDIEVAVAKVCPTCHRIL